MLECLWLTYGRFYTWDSSLDMLQSSLESALASDHQSFLDLYAHYVEKLPDRMDRAWQRQIETTWRQDMWIQMINKALQSMTGRVITTPIIHSFMLKHHPSSSVPSTVTIRKLLKHKFDMWWKHPESRPIQSQRSDVVKNRKLFAAVMKFAASKQVQFVFVDESSFSSWHLWLKSWVWWNGQDKIFKPVAHKSVASMNALCDDGWLMTKLWLGTNKEHDFVDFLRRSDEDSDACQY